MTTSVLGHVWEWAKQHRGGVGFALALLLVVGAAQASTTISTSISTGGNLTVTGTTALGGGSTITELLFGTCTVDLPSATASSTVVATCSATGVATTDSVFVTPTLAEKNIVFKSASSTATNVIQVAAFNEGYAGTIDPASQTWSWMALR